MVRYRIEKIEGGSELRIAIIGAIDSVEKIYKILSEEYREIEFVTYKEDEIKKLVEKIRKTNLNVDGIFFTGIGVYSKLSSQIDFQGPTIYTDRGVTGIIKAFWDLIKDNKKIEGKRIGLDVVRERDLVDVLNEFKIELGSYYIQDYLAYKSEEKYLDFYIKEYRAGRIDYVFTAFGHIYKYLKEKNIPVYRIQATNMDIKNRFNRLIQEIKLENINERVVQVQMIQIKNKNDKEISKLIQDISLEEKILRYTREIEGIIQTIDKDKYMIISNKGSGLSQENLTDLRKIIYDCKLNKLIVGVGIGEGETLFQSERNARNALSKSMSESRGNIYSYDGQNVIGPLMEGGELKYRNIVDGDGLKLAEEIGISNQYIEKIRSIIKKLGRDEFTSKELAQALSISERSSNRILRKIIDSGYGEKVGFVNPIGAGRPRRKIKIKL